MYWETIRASAVCANRRFGMQWAEGSHRPRPERWYLGAFTNSPQFGWSFNGFILIWGVIFSGQQNRNQRPTLNHCYFLRWNGSRVAVTMDNLCKCGAVIRGAPKPSNDILLAFTNSPQLGCTPEGTSTEGTSTHLWGDHSFRHPPRSAKQPCHNDIQLSLLSVPECGPRK